MYSHNEATTPSRLSRPPALHEPLGFDKQRRVEEVPLTLEAVAPVVREYLTSRWARVGPEFEGWLASYLFFFKTSRVKRRETISVGELVAWGESYLEQDVTTEETRRARRAAGSWRQQVQRYWEN